MQKREIKMQLNFYI